MTVTTVPFSAFVTARMLFTWSKWPIVPGFVGKVVPVLIVLSTTLGLMPPVLHLVERMTREAPSANLRRQVANGLSGGSLSSNPLLPLNPVPPPFTAPEHAAPAW
jgi:hypothetical protein